MKNKCFKVLFIIFASLTILILVQGFTHIIPLKLEGYTPENPKVEFNFQNLKDGSYQKYLEQYSKENCGFREIFIRCYNQMLFSFFHQISNENIIEGKNHELFLRMYTEEATGKNFRENFPSIDSAQSIAEKNIEKTLLLMDSLRKNGTQVLMVFAPAKTDIYPELLPEDIRKEITRFSIRDYYIQLAQENQIPYIDFVSIFKKMAKESPYPVYTKGGTHWAQHTIPYVADTLLRKIEDVLQRNMPRIAYVDSNICTHYTGADKELEDQMNLLFPLRKQALPNPIFELKDTNANTKPKLLVVGDSYFVALQNSCFWNCFSQVDYWKYNREIYSSNPNYYGEVQFFPAKYKVVSEADLVLFIFTTVSAYNYLYGFCETAFQALQNRNSNFSEEHILYTIQRIKNDPKWFKSVKEQAKEKNKSIEEMLLENALYVLSTEESSPTNNQ